MVVMKAYKKCLLRILFKVQSFNLRFVFKRNTDNYESFRSKTNNMFYKAHQKVYQFIEIFKNIQKSKHLKLPSTTNRKINI